MKMKLTNALTVSLLFLAATITAWSQATAGKVQGRVTDGGKPVANAEVVLTNADNGKKFKMKTDQNGQFFGVGIQFGVYEEEVTAGEKQFKRKVQVVGEGGAVDDLSVELTAGKPGAGPSKEEMDKMKAEREKGIGLNALIVQYNAAQTAKNWQQAADILKQMITAAPTRWDYQKALGDMEFNLAQYQEAIDQYEKVIPQAEDATKTDPKADPAKAKVAVSQMLTNEGNSYLKLKKNPEAVAAFSKAAAMDPNPSTAYWNICATQYNTGDMKGASASCDKAIAADPTRADAYFIKGSALIGMSDGKLDANGHYIALPGTTDALNKYLELAPDGPHAAEVKQMMEMLGAKIETTYHERKKK
jgi:tetratricopeptide (TPR) repeat protein